MKKKKKEDIDIVDEFVSRSLDALFTPEKVAKMKAFLAHCEWAERYKERMKKAKERARERKIEKFREAERIIDAGGSFEDIEKALGKVLFKKAMRGANWQLTQWDRTKKRAEKKEIARKHKEEHARLSAFRIAERNNDPEFSYRKIRGFAASQGADFPLTAEEFKKLWYEDCFYCGDPGARGLDRADPDKGYSIGNLVPCCPRCKKLKGKYQRSVFLNICRKVADRHPYVYLDDEVRHFTF